MRDLRDWIRNIISRHHKSIYNIMRKMSPHACAVTIEYRFNLNYKSIESQKCDQFFSNL